MLLMCWDDVSFRDGPVGALFWACVSTLVLLVGLHSALAGVRELRSERERCSRFGERATRIVQRATTHISSSLVHVVSNGGRLTCFHLHHMTGRMSGHLLRCSVT